VRFGGVTSGDELGRKLAQLRRAAFGDVLVERADQEARAEALP
jgi:hypothetical protein